MKTSVLYVTAFLLSCSVSFGGAKPIIGNSPSKDQCPALADVHVFTVGIDKYAEPAFVQQFAAADATAVGDIFAKIGATVTALRDEKATRAEIESAIEEQAAGGHSCDTFVFFFSGWGNSSTADDFFLYPVDTKREEVRQTGISGGLLWAWLAKISARHILILMDTGDASDFLDYSLSKMRRTRDDSTDQDVTIIAPQGNSFEDKALGHGLMSSAILASIGAASDLNRDGYLSAAEIETAIAQQSLQAQSGMPKLSVRARSVSSGGDFFLGKVGATKQETSSRGSKPFIQDNPPESRKLAGKYVAYLIATDDYDDKMDWPHLDNPVNDATTIAAQLKTRFGFEVHLIRNAKKKDFSDAVSAIKHTEFQPDDELLVFVAGHGTFDPSEKTGYLVVQDSRSQAEDPEHDSYYSQVKLLNALTNLTAQHVFVVIDACQSGAQFMAKNRSGDTKLDITYAGSKLDAILRKKDKRSFFYMTSGGNEYVPDGIPGHHSPFAYQFISALSAADSDPDQIVTMRTFEDFADRVHDAPQPLYGPYQDKSEPAADFWLVGRPDLRAESTQ